MRKVLVFPGATSNEGDFAIDEEDFLTVTSFIESTQRIRDDQIWKVVRGVVKIRENDEDCRVYKLKADIRQRCFREQSSPSSVWLQSLPESIGDLASLEVLDLSCSNIRSLPQSFGRLLNLKDLSISRLLCLTDLPEQIGDLANLERLNLGFTGISSLPPVIGRLQNLKELDLRSMRQMSNLPDEIGDLSGLKSLTLSWSTIIVLPPSIGRLQNLQELDLSLSKYLTALPEEIGDLSGLQKLDLHHCKVKVLPRSIGRLQNLEYLSLAFTKSLSTLPEEIGNLGSLKELILHGSFIQSLPISMRCLTSLFYLSIDQTRICSQVEYLSILVDHLPLLASIGTNKYYSLLGILDYNLACNRARFQTKVGLTANKETIQPAQKLWPHILSHATLAFNAYPPCYSQLEKYIRYYSIPEPDAIHHFLVHGRESFIRVLVNRNEDAHTRTKDR